MGMNWILDSFGANPTAEAVIIIATVCVTGMALGSIKYRGIGLGTSGVLFAGILAGRMFEPIEHETLAFIKEFGLILFVFTIGLQLGPGFFASFRHSGIRLNLLAASIVALGGITAVALGWLCGIDHASIPGLFSGATTNTPSLGAAEQTVSQILGGQSERVRLVAMAYAVCYPFAIAGIILSLLLIKSWFAIDSQKEEADFAAGNTRPSDPIERRSILVNNPNLDGIAIEKIPSRQETGVVVSRIRVKGSHEVQTALRGTSLHIGDVILAVGTQSMLDQFTRVVGYVVEEDLVHAPGSITYRRVVVTNKSILGKSFQELDLEDLFGVTGTRIMRSGLEMTAVPNVRLQFGDVLQLVGSEQSLAKAAEFLGNSVKALNETHFIPLFAGIMLGALLGSIPIQLPGIPQPLRLGLAGGPLVVAILFGRIGHIGRLVWHMPLNSNLTFREFGISLFFASVGLLAGADFFNTVFSTTGIIWASIGICVTMLPILVMGIFARKVWKMNYLTLSGAIAGSMTDPPALAFATNITGSDAPNASYAAVYPLTTFLRILLAQILAVCLCG